MQDVSHYQSSSSSTKLVLVNSLRTFSEAVTSLRSLETIQFFFNVIKYVLVSAAASLQPVCFVIMAITTNLRVSACLHVRARV